MQRNWIDLAGAGLTLLGLGFVGTALLIFITALLGSQNRKSSDALLAALVGVGLILLGLLLLDELSQIGGR